MAHGIGLRDHAAEALAEHDRLFDAEAIAECLHVVAPLVQGPGCGRARLAAAIAAVIDVEHLRDVGEVIEIRPHARMVEAGAAVHDDQRRLLDQARPVDTQFFADDVEEDALAVERHEHETSRIDMERKVARRVTAGNRPPG